LTGDRLLADDLAALDTGAAAARSARLHFECDGDGRSFLAQQHTPYPFHICRPFYLPSDPIGMATVYLQSCAGGIFEGDQLDLEILAAAHTRAHVTTSASTIVHSMPGASAAQRVLLHTSESALLEFLPDPLILFPGSRLSSQVRVRLGPASTVLLADAFLLHDPCAQQRVFDSLQSEVCIEDEAGRLLAMDRIHATGKAVAAQWAGVTGAFAAQGSFYVLHQQSDQRAEFGALLGPLRAALDSMDGIYGGASLLPNGAGLFVRVLAADAITLRAALQRVWQQARMAITGMTPMPRRK
jgi:urease accessory protein